MEAINWEPILWVGGGLGATIVLLLGWIAVMIKDDKKRSEENYVMHDKRLRKHDKIFIKHDKKFAKQHNEIKNLILVLKPKNGN